MNSEQLVSCGSLSKIPNWEGRKTNNQIRRNWVFGTGSLRVDWAVKQTLRNGSDLSQAAQTQAEGGRKHQWVNVCAPSSGAACRWRGARRGYGVCVVSRWQMRLKHARGNYTLGTREG